MCRSATDRTRQALVARERADVVVMIMVERSLPRLGDR